MTDMTDTDNGSFVLEPNWRILRHRAHKTLGDLARYANVSVVDVSALERGEKRLGYDIESKLLRWLHDEDVKLDKAAAAAARLDSANTLLRHVLEHDLRKPWPLTDILEKLADAAAHLLVAHGCDDHGYEETEQVLSQARRAAEDLRRLLLAVAEYLRSSP